MRDVLYEKGLVLGVINLFVGVNVVLGTGINGKEPSDSESSNLEPGNTTYVDDDNTNGPWDGTQEHPYQWIQDGIYNANDGDTVFVFIGIYYENIVVYKSICLIGEDNQSTVIDGGRNGICISIFGDGNIINGFTIQNGGNTGDDAGIRIHSSLNIILYNSITSNGHSAIIIEGNHNNTISHNIISSNNGCGISIYRSSRNNYNIRACPRIQIFRNVLY